MKKAFWIICLFPLFAFHPGKKALHDHAAFNTDSYFRENVYAEHTWKSFYELAGPQQMADPAAYDIHLLNAALFFATNKLRAIKGCPPLPYLEGLKNAAALHTHQMTRWHFFSHDNTLQKKYHSPEMRMELFGITQKLTGENIDLQFLDEELSYTRLAEMIVEDFYDSPGHRVNMLNRGYHYLGCAAEIEPGKAAGEYTIRATQNFCGK